jgi:succinate dehydrogenase / fumarate reductase, membrane anchor subunit
MSLRSPVGRVLGLGSAGEGSGHWWTQRVTSVALVLLGLVVRVLAGPHA